MLRQLGTDVQVPNERFYRFQLAALLLLRRFGQVELGRLERSEQIEALVVDLLRQVKVPDQVADRAQNLQPVNSEPDCLHSFE